MLTLAENDNGSDVAIRPGESIRISLPENATTGFSWEIDRYADACIEALARESSYPAGGAVGSAGRVAFTFKGKKPGQGEIALVHRRPWEKNQPPIAEFHVRIRIVEA
jgi:inhibitor of cysteine peptidase